MSLGRNKRLESFIDMLERGEVHRARQGCATLVEWAARLGMTEGQFRGIQRRARMAGHAVPGWGAVEPVEDFETEEPTVNDGSRERAGTPVEIRAEGAPPLPAIPTGHRVRGVSTLVDADGTIKGQWLKTTAVNDERQDWLEAVRDVAGESAKFEPVALPQRSDDRLLTVYPVGDPHIGLLAWHEDAGENFDMDIAERNIVSAFAHLTSLAPASRDALLVFIGDNAHADSQSNTTTKGTRVDADGRTVKMARRIVRTIRRSVDLALAKHERVRLIIERGNHDELISAMIALAMSLLYENEPRVSVDTSPEMYHWFRFGKNLIGTHHGHGAKPMDLLGVMAVDRVQDWGETKHRRMYCGHYHHLITKEVPGLVVEYLPTLAGSDAWHRAMGYRSQRAMYMDVYDIEDGHANRFYVGIEQVVRRAG